MLENTFFYTQTFLVLETINRTVPEKLILYNLKETSFKYI